MLEASNAATEPPAGEKYELDSEVLPVNTLSPCLMPLLQKLITACQSSLVIGVIEDLLMEALGFLFTKGARWFNKILRASMVLIVLIHWSEVKGTPSPA